MTTNDFNNKNKLKEIKFIDNTEEIEKYFIKTNLRKRSRLKLLPEQIRVLELNFTVDSKPSASTKNFIAKSLGIPIKNVQIWFQNRRAKAKLIHEEQIADQKEKSIDKNKVLINNKNFYINNEKLTQKYKRNNKNENNFMDIYSMKENKNNFNSYF